MLLKFCHAADYAYFYPLLFLFLGFLMSALSLPQGERSTVSREQSRQMLMPKAGIHQHSGKPQTSALPGPDRLQSDSPTPTQGEAWPWAERLHWPSFQGGSLQTKQQTCTQTEKYYLLLLLEIIVSDNYIY